MPPKSPDGFAAGAVCAAVPDKRLFKAASSSLLLACSADTTLGRRNPISQSLEIYEEKEKYVRKEDKSINIPILLPSLRYQLPAAAVEGPAVELAVAGTVDQTECKAAAVESCN